MSATTFPFNNSLLGCFSNSCAISRRYMIFSFERSAIVTKLCFSIRILIECFEIAPKVTYNF